MYVQYSNNKRSTWNTCGKTGGKEMKPHTKQKQRKVSGKRQKHSRRIAALRAEADSDWAADNIGKLYKPIKKPVTLRLDADVLTWFKAQGRGYQTRINRALRGVMERDRK